MGFVREQKEEINKLINSIDTKDPDKIIDALVDNKIFKDKKSLVAFLINEVYKETMNCVIFPIQLDLDFLVVSGSKAMKDMISDISDDELTDDYINQNLK